MNEIPHARNDITGANWVFFGEFAAPVEQSMDQQMDTWLAETLRPLNLKTDLLEKVIASAQKATRAQSKDDPETGQLYIQVYATSAVKVPGQTWGFFRTEKKDGSAENEPRRHTITFYLYLEGMV